MRIRRVRADEWHALRDLRLRGLETDPDAFGGTLAESLTKPDAEWQARAASTETVTFVAVRRRVRRHGIGRARPGATGHRGQSTACGWRPRRVVRVSAVR